MLISSQLSKLGICATAVLGTVFSTWTSYKYLVVKNVEEHIKWKYNENVLTENSTNTEWKELIDGKNVHTSRELDVFAGWKQNIQFNEKINQLRNKCLETIKVSRWDKSYDKKIDEARKFCIHKKP